MTPPGFPRSPDGRAGRVFRLGSSQEYGPQQVVLALVIVLTPVAFLACAALAGGQLSPWLLVAAPLLVLLVAQADSMLPLGLWAVLAAIWVIQVPGPFSWWSVPAALCALLAHVAFALLAGAPTTVMWSGPTLLRQSRRLGVVAGATLVVAGAAELVLGAQLQGQVLLAVGAMLTVAAWVWVGRWRDEGRAGEPTRGVVSDG
jgi:hypothetical protein